MLHNILAYLDDLNECIMQTMMQYVKPFIEAVSRPIFVYLLDCVVFLGSPWKADHWMHQCHLCQSSVDVHVYECTVIYQYSCFVFH